MLFVAHTRVVGRCLQAAFVEANNSGLTLSIIYGVFCELSHRRQASYSKDVSQMFSLLCYLWSMQRLFLVPCGALLVCFSIPAAP